MQFSRTRLLFGDKSMNILRKSRVALFGLGGVGGYAAEVLARSGIGSLDIIDNDKVALSNLNRQIYALHSTVGQYKVDVAENRIHDIFPECTVRKYCLFYLPENSDLFDFKSYDYVVDCIDTVTAKIDLVERCTRMGVPIISSMGAANKLDPTQFRVADIYQTRVDPLARVMRKALKSLGIKHLKCVYSEEPPMMIDQSRLSASDLEEMGQRRSLPASNAFVPPAAGLIIGGEVVKDLIAPSLYAAKPHQEG